MDTKDIVGIGGNPAADICSKNFPKKIIEIGFAIPK